MGLNISLTPEDVRKLANDINRTVNSLEGVDKILNESRKDYLSAIDLKKRALEARFVYLYVIFQLYLLQGLCDCTNRFHTFTKPYIPRQII